MTHLFENINAGWLFTKDATEAPVSMPEGWEKVDLPHCWNSVDGQDGGNDYHRGTCYYAKELAKPEMEEGGQVYLQFEGANSSADVFVNGEKLCHHDGGYSTFRVNITESLRDNNVIAVAVDNAPNDRVYPQMADFTFYGGIYRNVSLIVVPATHFDLEFYGSPAIQVTPEINRADAKVTVKTYITNGSAQQQVEISIKEADGTVVETKTVSADVAEAVFEIKNVHLWNGRKDPYLYTAEARLVEGDKELDTRSTRFGCRTFKIDPEKGFILNGESYPLRGVSRHQDRWGVGNALSREEHIEDMDLICEVGATTIRLAHYQHDQFFYDLCDERGMVVWAEIPYISKHMPTGRENTITQMKELVAQNYNHPSIVVWGLSNEITMNGSEDPDLVENHHILNDLCHEMDPTRLTVMAIVSMCDMDSPYIQIPDVVSWNHYFGWYGGNTSMNGPWLDKFHAKYPNLAVGLSEYGCEALNWHASKIQQGDYTEEYQAYYHEELIKQLYTRPYIWATHVWNMFDFGADAREEGGENGQNHKGLVTFDRKYKKDSFYAYKAWLSDEPFVHLCGKRYIDRVEDVTKVTVYSNLPEVELFANGVSLGKQTSDVHFFYFDVPNAGETKIEVVAGDCKDEGVIRKVDTFNEEYRMKEVGAVLNWFDITEVEGYLSLNDTIEDIMKPMKGKLLMMGLMKDLMSGMKNDDGKVEAAGFELNEGMMQMMGGFTLRRAIGMMGMMVPGGFKKEFLLDINAKLNKIKRKDN